MKSPFSFEMFLLVISMAVEINSEPEPGPGIIYYRKPTKLAYYKKHPPVLIYPKKEDNYEPMHKSHYFDHKSYKPIDIKYFIANPNFLQINHKDKYHIKKMEKKPEYDWLSWLFGEDKETPETHLHTYEILKPTNYENYNNKYQPPVILYHPYKPLNIVPPQFQQHYQHINPHLNSDIKPVVEHIEGDIKYDFRTKTHSYDR